MFRQNFHALLSVNHSAPQQYNGIEKDPGAKLQLQHKRPTPCYPIVPKQKLVRRSELSKFIGNVVRYAMRHAKGSYRLTDNKHFVFFFIFIPMIANYLLLSSFDATFYDPHIRVYKFSYVLLLPKIVLLLFCCVRSFPGVNRLLGSVSLSLLCYAWIFEYIGTR